jgi:hypothetical protein
MVPVHFCDTPVQLRLHYPLIVTYTKSILRRSFEILAIAGPYDKQSVGPTTCSIVLQAVTNLSSETTDQTNADLIRANIRGSGQCSQDSTNLLQGQGLQEAYPAQGHSSVALHLRTCTVCGMLNIARIQGRQGFAVRTGKASL